MNDDEEQYASNDAEEEPTFEDYIEYMDIYDPEDHPALIRRLTDWFPDFGSSRDPRDLLLLLAAKGYGQAVRALFELTDSLQILITMDEDIMDWSQCVCNEVCDGGSLLAMNEILAYGKRHDKVVHVFFCCPEIIEDSTGIPPPLAGTPSPIAISRFYLDEYEKAGRLAEFVLVCASRMPAYASTTQVLLYRFGYCAKYYDCLPTDMLMDYYHEVDDLVLANVIRDVLLSRDRANLDHELAARLIGLRLGLPGEVTRVISGYNKDKFARELRMFGNRERSLPVTTVANRPKRFATHDILQPTEAKKIKIMEDQTE